MPFEKVSDTSFKETETKVVEKVHNITDLKNDRAIYVSEIEMYQRKIDAIDILLAQADILGVVEATPVEEVLPKDVPQG